MQPPKRPGFATFCPAETCAIVFVWPVIKALRTSKWVNWSEVIYEIGWRWSAFADHLLISDVWWAFA